MAIGYDHGYYGKVFYLGLALDPAYVEGFVEGALERIGEDEPDEEEFLRSVWEDGGDRDFTLKILKNGVEVRLGRPPETNLPEKWFGYSLKAGVEKL